MSHDPEVVAHMARTGLLGVLLIGDERAKQVEKGWTPEHDDGHGLGEITEAALCFAAVASAQQRGSTVEEWPVEMFDGLSDSILKWPWEDEAFKLDEDPIENLKKAGALIGAEIDRLKRLRDQSS